MESCDNKEKQKNVHGNLEQKKSMEEDILPIVKKFAGEVAEEFLKHGQKEIFRIADTGCATGANSMLTVESVVESVTQTLQSRGLDRPPQFHAFFCDLPVNDFNTLLRDLPAFHKDEQSSACRSYSAAAVCGSHHNRLFPNRFLHFCSSSRALHYLSRVPPEVEDRSSAAWNGEHIFISNNDEVAEAYLKQCRRDFIAFLRCRAEEMAEGGGLLLHLQVREPTEAIHQDRLFSILQNVEIALNEMAEQGLIERRRLEELNMPFFTPTPKEVADIINEENSFEIREMKFLKMSLQKESKGREEIEMLAESVEMMQRRAVGGLLADHFKWDKETEDQFFYRIKKRVLDNPQQFLNDQIAMVVISMFLKP